MIAFRPYRQFRIALMVAAFALSGCGGRDDHGPIVVDVIGSPSEVAEPLRNATRTSGKVLLGATAQGLVAFDASGEVVNALAERWIVEDDGRSYIFRIKNARWADDEPVKAQEVARALKARMAANPTLLAGMKPDVLGMTDQVVEIRLDGPAPSFLQLLAQPAMAVARPGGGTGPFRKTTEEGVVTLHPASGDEAEATDDERAVDEPEPLYVRASRAALAFARFKAGHSDLVLGGRFEHLPLVAVANLPPGTVRADPVSGLFGLMVEGKSDFLANRDVREILSMAIDRERLLGLLNLQGWQTATTLLPAPLDLARPPTQVPWAERPMDLRRGYARSVVNNWRAMHGEIAPLRIALPPGPGARMLFFSLAADYRAIGLSLKPVAPDAAADLRLIDEVAPFDSALWYLARLDCEQSKLCSEEAQASLDTALKAQSDQERQAALDSAEMAIVGQNNFIPIGMPIRFSLVRGRLTGFQPSPRAVHPLNALVKGGR
jgi:oligopeptide transport system substrate-binding protein